MSDVTHFLVDKTDLTQTRVVSKPLPPLGAGEVLVKVDRVAMTANNITYAAIAHLIPYWEFFPWDEGWGRLPVWGFGDVVESRADLAVSTRLYGFWASSTHLMMKPRVVRPGLVIDAVDHRSPLPAIYNQYVPTDEDPTYSAEAESLTCIFRPLFMTAFSLDELFGAEGFEGASTIAVSAASSKTAWATSHLLAKRDGTRIIGLTSKANRTFVEALGCYDHVITYDSIDDLFDESWTAYLDFAGSRQLRVAVRKAVGPNLLFDLSVGMAHWAETRFAEVFESPTVTSYSAPSMIQRRSEAIGREEYFRLYAEAWRGFAPHASASVEFVESIGLGALATAYQDTASGTVSLATGLIVRPNS